MITEFGAVKVRGGEVLGEFQTLVNPRSHDPAADRRADRDHQPDGRRRARACRQVLPAFLAFAEGTVHRGAQRPVRRRLPAPGLRGLELPVPALAGGRHRGAGPADPARATRCRTAGWPRWPGTSTPPTTPNHRALTDAQATVDVLHGLIERVGNLGVHTIEDLREFTRRVSPQRRAKRTWASRPARAARASTCSSPSTTTSGTCSTSASPRTSAARVRTYFTAAEKRPPDGRDGPGGHRGRGRRRALTALQADVTELRLIASPRAALQPALEVPRAHAVDQDHRRGVPPAVRGPGRAGRRRHLLRAVPPPAGGRGRACWRSTTGSRSGSAPRGSAPTSLDQRLRAGRHGPLLARPATAPSPATTTPTIVEQVRAALSERRPAGGARASRPGCAGWSSSSGSRRRPRSGAGWRP